MPLPFDLSKIQLKEYFFLELAILNHSPELIQGRVPLADVRLDRTMSTSFAPDESMIEINLKFVANPFDKNQRPYPVQGRFHVVMRFIVIDLADYLEKTPETAHLLPARELVYTVVGLAYSTARGLLLERTRDTVLDGFTLPAVDTRTLAWNPGSPPPNVLPG